MADNDTVNYQVIRPLGITEALKYQLRRQYEVIEGYNHFTSDLASLYRAMNDIYYRRMRFIDNLLRHG